MRESISILAVFLIALMSVGAEHRSAAAVRAFRKVNACPATSKFTGPCDGWVIDHRVPLCAGGPDRPDNMQWQAYAESKVKDKWEVELCNFLRKEGR